MDCTQLEWSPLGSASSHSALAGVLAGLVFAGIVVLFSDRNPSPQRTRAVVLFSGALLALAFDSFIFGAIAGEQVCAKAWAETMLAAGLLGLGAVGIFGGISWLFNAYDHDGRTTRLAKFITYTVAVIVGYHLQVTAASYLVDMQTTRLNQPPAWLIRTVDGYALGIVALILLFPVGRRLADVASLRLALLRPKYTAVARDADRATKRFDRAATTAAYLSVVYVIVVAVISGTLMNRTKGGWEPATPTIVVATATLTSLAIATLALIIQLRALPHRVEAASSNDRLRTPGPPRTDPVPNSAPNEPASHGETRPRASNMTD